MTLARHRDHRRGASLFFEGDRAHDVLLLCSGQVKVTRVSSDGREVVLDVVGPGDILGELSAIDGDVRSATATTLTATRVATLSIAEFNAFLERHPGAATALLRAIAGRLRGASRRQLEFGTMDALGRVCTRLVEMMDRYGVAEGESVLVTAPISQQELADWSGLSREAVVKALHVVRALGWATTRRGGFLVLDAAAIRDRAAPGVF